MSFRYCLNRLSFWDYLNLVDVGLSLIGLVVSVSVAFQLRTFRREVLLRGALEDLEKKLGGVERNLQQSLGGKGDSKTELATLNAHTVDLVAKLPKGDAKTRASNLLRLLNGLAPAVPDVLPHIAGLRTALGHFRRDQRWKL